MGPKSLAIAGNNKNAQLLGFESTELFSLVQLGDGFRTRVVNDSKASLGCLVSKNQLHM